MTKTQKLELTWIAKEEQSYAAPRIRLEFPEDPRRDDSPTVRREAILEACGDPRCGCVGIHFQWQAAPEDPKPCHDFWYDLKGCVLRLTPEMKKDPEVLRLGEILHTELTPEMRIHLRDWFMLRKQDIIESTPLDDFDSTGLPDSSDGKMVGFVDVFPRSHPLEFTWNNERWAVDEQYCVQPRCTCEEAVLSFLKLRGASGKKARFAWNTPVLRYNYLSEATKTVAKGSWRGPSLTVLLDALKREHTDLNFQLRHHHQIMHALYLRQKGSKQVEADVEESENTSPSTTRNAPCPCGSGRKYKHCCLKKSRA